MLGGTDGATGVNDLYRRLCRAAGVSGDARHAPARPGEQRRSVLDASRAKTVLGWSPTTPLDEGLEPTLASTREEVGT